MLICVLFFEFQEHFPFLKEAYTFLLLPGLESKHRNEKHFPNSLSEIEGDHKSSVSFIILVRMLPFSLSPLLHKMPAS